MREIDWDLRPPKRWEDFEALCTDLFAAEFSLTDISRYGKRGCSQDGVDIFGFRSRRKRNYGIQCKKKQQWPVTSLRNKEDLCDQIDMATRFYPPLDYYFIVTTAPKRRIYDDVINNHLHHHPEIPFEVRLFCWDDINTLLNGHEDIVRKYYPELFETRVSTLAERMEMMNKREIFFVYRAGQSGKYEYLLQSKNYDHTYISVTRDRLGLAVMKNDISWRLWEAGRIGYMYVDLFKITNLADSCFIKKDANCFRIFMGQSSRSWDINYETGGPFDGASLYKSGFFKGSHAYDDEGMSLDPEEAASMRALWDTLQALHEEILSEETIVP